MTSAPVPCRTPRIFRTGRHAPPSQAGKVAQTAGKAVPAVAVVGALAGLPQLPQAASAAAGSPAAPPAGGPSAASAAAGTVTPARLDAAGHPAALAGPARAARPGRTAHPAGSARPARAGRRLAAARRYDVHAGDTLSAIAARFYGRTADWRALYQVNHRVVSNPDLIYPGQKLALPQVLPAVTAATAAALAPAPARAAAAPAAAAAPRHTSAGDGDHDGDDGYRPRHAKVTTTAARTGSGGAPASGGAGRGLSGTLACGGLEALWESAGGSPAAAVTAASVAMAESGGNQFATGTVGERGYWQINPVNGALSTYDAYGNARSAVIMSSDGTNWSAWTTYTSGAYLGRC